MTDMSLMCRLPFEFHSHMDHALLVYLAYNFEYGCNVNHVQPIIWYGGVSYK